jgi:hypothetical protein
MPEGRAAAQWELVSDAGAGTRVPPSPPSHRPAAALPPDLAFALALPQPDWLAITLTVTGPADQIAAFRQAAAGAGFIPWVFDYDRLEEDWFHLLIAPPSHLRAVSLSGARILARQLREAAWARHEEAVSLVGISRACSFDLYRLLPVPFDILRLGDDDPRAIAWLWENWGTIWPLRRVEALATIGEDTFQVRFCSADWAPWQAIKRLQAGWPALRFGARASY